MNDFGERLIAALAIIIIAFIVSILFAWPFMLLWNWLMPMIFGLMKLTFWQAFGLLILCEFMFKSSNISSKS